MEKQQRTEEEIIAKRQETYDNYNAFHHIYDDWINPIDYHTNKEIVNYFKEFNIPKKQHDP